MEKLECCKLPGRDYASVHEVNLTNGEYIRFSALILWLTVCQQTTSHAITEHARKLPNADNGADSGPVTGR